MIAQTGIFLFGMTAIWLANDHRPQVRRFGCSCGLMAQPFWYYEAATHAQWGIFASSFFYTYSWARGFLHQWLKPIRDRYGRSPVSRDAGHAVTIVTSSRPL